MKIIRNTTKILKQISKVFNAKATDSSIAPARQEIKTEERERERERESSRNS